jgi:hypothetical protein
MELIPEIRKWFAFNNIKAVGEPERIKRPWLSIIKKLVQPKYSIENKEGQFKITPTKKKNETRKKNIKIVLFLKISREEPIFIARPFQALGARNLVV